MEEAMSLIDYIQLVVAEDSRIVELCEFLSREDIDRSFVLPLSSRDISIRERVVKIQKQGFWLLAIHGNKIVGCRGCKGIVDEKEDILEFSTTVVDPSYRGIGLGMLIFRQGVKLARDRYKPKVVRMDSTPDNEAIKRMAADSGFVVSRIYDDPVKRGSGGKSIEYILCL